MCPMSVEVRKIKKKELRAFVATIETAFGHAMRASDIPTFEKKIDFDRMHGAFDEEDIVGTAGVFPFRLTIPGNVIDAAGVTMIGVLPSHRRRGILRQMMEVQMLDARKRGEAVAILWASEESIYQRFGYGMATNQGNISIERDRATFLNDPGPRGRARMVPPEERVKVLPSIYETVRPETPGMYERTTAWWEAHSLYDPEHMRDGGSPYFCAVIELEGNAEAYAIYRVRAKWGEKDATPQSVVEVREVVATSPEGTREIWRYVFGIDLVERIIAYYLPADWPLMHMVEEPRRLRYSFSDSLWLRIIEMKAALEARSYATEDTLVFEVRDDFCAWNNARWRLDSGARRVERTEDQPDLVLSVNDLAGPYLGGFTFGHLAAAGRVREVSPGALERADAAFRTPRAPWCPENF